MVEAIKIWIVRALEPLFLAAILVVEPTVQITKEPFEAKALPTYNGPTHVWQLFWIYG